jgi:hypothetical protein
MNDLLNSHLCDIPNSHILRCVPVKFLYTRTAYFIINVCQAIFIQLECCHRNYGSDCNSEFSVFSRALEVYPNDIFRSALRSREC